MKRYLPALFFLLYSVIFSAVTPITDITTMTTTIGPTTINGVTFNGLNRAVTQMSDADGNVYTPSSMGTDAYIRRNTTVGNSNNSSVTFASVSSTEFLSAYATSLSTVLLSNNLYRSSDNIFTNGTTADRGNIERVDFLFNGSVGVQATDLMNISILERGLVNAHDGFNIALITGWNSATNTPTSFTTITTVSMLDFGSYNASVDGVANYSYNYNLFRYNTGNDLSIWTQNNQTGNQGIGAIILDMVGLGANIGQTIYGYSISADDTTTNKNQYVNWNNTNRFPSNSINGFDLYGVNGMTWEKRPPIPEPSTYGVILAGLSVVLSYYAKYRNKLSKV